MKILAFDTSGAACSVALFSDRQKNTEQIKQLHRVIPQQQAHYLLPMIHQLLDSCETKLNELDALVYGCGPGSFTGTRIASSVASAFSFALKIPIIKISSLAAMAQSSFLEHQIKNIWVAVHARYQQIYWATYQANADGIVQLIGKEKLCSPIEVQVSKASLEWCGVGDGWEKYKTELENALPHLPRSVYPNQLPSAEALLKLGMIQFELSNFLPVHEAFPVYLS